MAASAPDDAELAEFAETAGKGQIRQTEELRASILEEARREGFQPDVALREDLQRTIDAGAGEGEIIAHPAVVDAIRRMDGIVPTNKRPGYLNDDWLENRVFNIDGEEVVGYEAGVAKMYDLAMSQVPQGVAQSREVVFVLGPPASGKSMIAEQIRDSRRAMIIDSDDYKKTLPEFEGGMGSNATHAESKYVMAEIIKRAVEENRSIVIPTVGHVADLTADLISQFKGMGYRVTLMHMRVPYEEAFRRMIARFIRDGRLIAPGYMREVGDNTRKTYYDLKAKGLADSHGEVDNSAPLGAPREILDDPDGIVSLWGIGGHRSGRGDARAPPQDSRAGALEVTEQGEQFLVEGVAPVRQRERLEAELDRPLRGGEATPDFGLFDVGARGQGDLLDIEIPIGQREGPAGEIEVQTKTPRQMLVEAEQDQRMLKRLEGCVT